MGILEMTEDVYLLGTLSFNGSLSRLNVLKPTQSPIVEEKEPEPSVSTEPPEIFLLPPPKNPYDMTTSYYVRMIKDSENTKNCFVTSRNLRIWLFEESGRLEYGTDGEYVFAQWPEPELSDSLKEHFDYNPDKFPPHMCDMRKRRSRLPWTKQEEAVLVFTLEHFIPTWVVSRLLGRPGYAIRERGYKFALVTRCENEFRPSRTSWRSRVRRISLMTLFMLTAVKIFRILDMPQYQWKLTRRIRIIE